MTDKSFDPIPTRHSLLNRLKDWGDQVSWQDFFDTYWRLIYNVAVKAGLTDTEAQEVVQETVIAVAKKISEFKADPTRGSFSAWLMHTTRWRIADQFRKRQKAGQECSLSAAAEAGGTPTLRTDDTGLSDPINRVPDPAGVRLETVWNEEWEKNLMAAALEQVKSKVSPRQFQMFDLHVLQNLSVRDTARTMQVSVASVYMARHRVSRLLKREGAKLKKKMV
ncbi:MAG: RNA polymerase subunit sigma [Verrucomicrobia bacterium]|nr:MAG: RNA polymerase subunit sigma [Verrucomicrobiota bacterium]PYJ97570.1 MAG: RNA polymerase subunit sigma [Verrucomicrobiota bacterium]